MKFKIRIKNGFFFGAGIQKNQSSPQNWMIEETPLKIIAGMTALY